MTQCADVIVVGLGAMGAATLHALARRGIKTIGLDRFAPPHDLGSSHGETRITRQAVGEGDVYVPLVLRSHALWRELEAATGAELLVQCGFVAIDSSGGSAMMHGKTGLAERTIGAANRFGIAHELPTPGEFSKHFPAFALRGDERIYYEPGGGYVYPERCIAAQIDQARLLGAEVRLNTPVTMIRQHRGHVEVTTPHERLLADRIVLAAGGWTLDLGGAVQPRRAKPLAGVRLLPQALHWFLPHDPEIYALGRFPTFAWGHGPRAEDSFYGFPIIPDGTAGVKLATEQFSRSVDTPACIDGIVGPGDARVMYDCHLDGRMRGLHPLVRRSATCFYTFTPDGDFVIDWHKDADRVMIVSACSGHGFKHSAGVGDHVAAVIAAEADLLPSFALNRQALGNDDDGPAPVPVEAVEP